MADDDIAKPDAKTLSGLTERPDNPDIAPAPDMTEAFACLRRCLIDPDAEEYPKDVAAYLRLVGRKADFKREGRTPKDDLVDLERGQEMLRKAMVKGQPSQGIIIDPTSPDATLSHKEDPDMPWHRAAVANWDGPYPEAFIRGIEESSDADERPDPDWILCRAPLEKAVVHPPSAWPGADTVDDAPNITSMILTNVRVKIPESLSKLYLNPIEYDYMITTHYNYYNHPVVRLIDGRQMYVDAKDPWPAREVEHRFLCWLLDRKDRLGDWEESSDSEESDEGSDEDG